MSGTHSLDAQERRLGELHFDESKSEAKADGAAADFRKSSNAVVADSTADAPARV
jgi:hypothetical protein